MARLAILFVFVSLFSPIRTSPTQHPYQESLSLNTTFPSLLWDPPSPNATYHLIFSSISSLLHTWHSTRYRNGHTIVPGTIPKGTLLHHGTSRKEVPATPEWTALDPEFSYVFCHSARAPEAARTTGGQAESTGGCWHLTLRTTRPLNILYFDGSAAAKVYGTLDAQDLIVFGDTFKYDGTDRDSPSHVWDEPERLRRLCEWGKRYDLDAFVRMQSSFEVMLCDFTAGLEEVSFLHLVSELEGAQSFGDEELRGDDGPREPGQPTLLKVYNAIDVGLRHGSSSAYSTPETRVHLDLTRLISFYDLGLFPSLVEGRSNAPIPKVTRYHDGESGSRFQKGLFDTQLTRGTWRVGPLGGISKADREHLMQRLDEVLQVSKSEAGGGDAIDWTSLYRQVKDRYAERLEMLHHILSSASVRDEASMHKSIHNVHIYIDGLLTPYILYGVRPPASSSYPSPSTNADGHNWATPILEQCSLHFVPSPSSHMTPSEHLLISGIRGTIHEICRVLVRLWALGVESRTSFQDISHLNSLQVKELHDTYVDELTALTSWLDWSTPWIRCSPTSSTFSSFLLDGCSYEETCYLPTWPLFHSLDPTFPVPKRKWPSKPRYTSSSDRSDEDDGDDDGEDSSEWAFPRPRCIRRVFPFHLP